MSELTSPIRTSRPAPSALERARLALVPVRVANAPRAPFAVLVFLLLGAGVVGLLMFNTQMQQDSFYATRLQHQADRLTAQQESLQLELNNLRDPQHLGVAARKLGMVQPPVPAAIDLRTGRILGIPTAATRDDNIPLYSRPPSRPPFEKPPIHVNVPAKTGQTGGTDGPASPTNDATPGTNKAGTPAQGAPR
jgi:hypothetical protein